MEHRARKRRELITAIIAGVMILVLFLAGFKFKIIHTILAGLSALAACFFPIWIVEGEGDSW